MLQRFFAFPRKLGLSRKRWVSRLRMGKGGGGLSLGEKKNLFQSDSKQLCDMDKNRAAGPQR
jgi:hypothetical protein